MRTCRVRPSEKDADVILAIYRARSQPGFPDRRPSDSSAAERPTHGDAHFLWQYTRFENYIDPET